MKISKVIIKICELTEHLSSVGGSLKSLELKVWNLACINEKSYKLDIFRLHTTKVGLIVIVNSNTQNKPEYFLLKKLHP